MTKANCNGWRMQAESRREEKWGRKGEREWRRKGDGE